MEEEQLKKLFLSVETPSSREDLLHYFKALLVSRIAQTRGFGKVLLGSTATSLAVDLIEWTCKARGCSLPLHLTQADDTHSNVTFIRPMRDFVAKEVAVYNYFKKLDYLIDGLAMLNPKATIGTLSHNFVEGLQGTFPHTVHTLLRSGSKLMPLPKDLPKCPICSSPVVMSEEQQECRKKQMSKLGVVGGSCDSCQDTCNSGSCHDNKEQPNVPITPFLCFGCRKVAQECTQMELMPPFVKQEVVKIFTNTQLRQRIKEFLLDDD